MGRVEPYRVSAIVETGAVVAPEGTAPPKRSKKAERAAQRQKFFEGVATDFDVNLDNLRDAFVGWQLFSRKRKRSTNPFERLRLDFSPPLEKIYSKFSLGRHIYLHNFALPLVFTVYVLLSGYSTVTSAALRAHNYVSLAIRIIATIVMASFLVLTRCSKWKGARTMHLIALNGSFLVISLGLTIVQQFENRQYVASMVCILVGFTSFIFVETSFVWQTVTGSFCIFIEVFYLYIARPPTYPLPFAHSLLVAGITAVVGGAGYLYICLRLARRLFLDQVLARLQEFQLEREKDRLNGLLHVILPKAIATRLKEGEQSIADRFNESTVMFVEVLDFDDVVASSSTVLAVKKLNKLYGKFDGICEKNHCLRIKIVGTTYMAICGVPTARSHHVELACTAALAMLDEMRTFCAEQKVSLRLRIGLNSGPLVAGVIGVEKFCYDVWGDTVNTASRMCTHAAPNVIQVTQAVRDVVDFAFDFDQLEESFFKGKGKMTTHSLRGKKVFERRTAPVPALDLTRLAETDASGEQLPSGAHLARAHLSEAHSGSLEGGNKGKGNSEDVGAATEMDGFERENLEGDESSRTKPLDNHAPVPSSHRRMSRTSSQNSSSGESTGDPFPVQRSTPLTPVRDSPRGLPGRISDSGEGSDDSSEAASGPRGPSHRNSPGRFTSLIKPTTLESNMHSSRTDISSDSDVSHGSHSMAGSAHSGGLGRFRQTLLSSVGMDGSSNNLASSRDSYAATARTTHRGKKGAADGVVLDTSRMNRARNLAAAFGFDGVSAHERELAENERYQVTTKCCFVSFADREMEQSFDDKSVKETLTIARVAYGWALILVLSGVIFDGLTFYTAPLVPKILPIVYTPAMLASGHLFRSATLSLGTLIGLRLGLGLPPLVLILLLTWHPNAVRMIPYMSLFTIWWVQIVEQIIIYVGAPLEIIAVSGRVIALLGSIHYVMRGMNVKRQFIASVVACPILIAGMLLSDPAGAYALSMILYNMPLFISVTVLRSRLQVSQRTYFIERTKVARRSKDITKEQDKANQMLLNIFPKTIYERIKRGEKEIVDNHKAAVVLFADVVGFTRMSVEYTPAEVVGTLNEIFTAFDGLMAKYNLEKIKTIGDCFVCSAGVSTFNTSPFANMASCALDMVQIMDGLRSGRGQKIEMRWGIHTGDVISAVVGDKKFLYDIFGEAVATANLMESSSVAGRILVSEPVAVALAGTGFILKQHKVVQTANGKALNTHFLMGKKDVERTSTDQTISTLRDSAVSLTYKPKPSEDDSEDEDSRSSQASSRSTDLSVGSTHALLD